MNVTSQSRKWWVMAPVAMGTFLSTIDGSIVNVALPTLARELHAPFAAVQWVVLSYLLTLVTLMLGAGRLADMFGKKPLYLAGFVIFTLGSVACGMSPGIGWLIGARVLQALGAVLLMALGAALVTEAFPPAERGKAMGLIGLMVSIGLVSGPTLGGLVLGFAPWRGIFFVNLPLGILGIAMVARFVPNTPAPARQRFDFRGALCLFSMLLGFLLAITLGPKLSFGSPLVLGGFGFSAVALWLFLRTEQRVAEPMLDLSIFSDPRLATNVVTGFMTFVASSGLIFLLPFFLQDLQGRSPKEAGLLLVVSPVAMGLAAPVSGWLSDRVGTRPVALFGLVTLVVGYLLAGTLQLSTSAFGYVARVFWLGLGMGIFQAPNNSAIMGSVPKERLGVASGLISFTRTLGQVTGIGLMGAFFAHRVHGLAHGTLRDVMDANAADQLQGMRGTVHAAAAWLLVASLIAAFAYRRERRTD